MDAADLVRTYYRALDEGDYDALNGILAEEFVHYRGDQTLEGRVEFVRFMRDHRPETDTVHVIDTIYDGPDGVAVRGRLRHGDGSVWFTFIDAFTVQGGRLRDLTTYTD